MDGYFESKVDHEYRRYLAKTSPSISVTVTEKDRLTMRYQFIALKVAIKQLFNEIKKKIW